MESRQPPSDDQAAAELHRRSLVIDMHSDVHLDVVRSRGRGERRVLERRHLPRWKAGGVDAVVLSSLPKFGPDPYPYHTSPVRNFLLMADAVLEDAAESRDCLLHVREPEDIARARDEGKVGLLLGVEGAEAVETDLGLLRCYARLGLRVMNLSWHQRNLAADGVAEPAGGGLSNFGRELVGELNRLGVLIDVSHLAPAGVRDVLELSEQPVIASHSNAKALCDHPRNLDDALIRDITAAGGLVGVVFLGRFVHPTDPTLDRVLDHIDHIAGLAGAGHVGIGPDYTDYCQDMIIASRRVAGPGQPADDATIPYARGLEDASKLPNLTAGLLARGYGEAAIRGILGENFLRVFTQLRRAANAS